MRTIREIEDWVAEHLRAEEQALLDLGCLNDPILLPKRIVDRITIPPLPNACWRTSGWNSGNGYANLSIKGRTYKVHRIVHHLLIGPLPTGHVADHDIEKGCRHRDCCNPWHMHPRTVKDNTDRGRAVPFPKRGSDDALSQ